MDKIASIFGTVSPPPGVGGLSGLTGITTLLKIALRTMIVGAGVYAIFNIILAGYAYISAGGDSKAVAGATSKITQAIIGLVVAVGAFVIAGVISKILYGNSGTLLNVKIYTQ